MAQPGRRLWPALTADYGSGGRFARQTAECDSKLAEFSNGKDDFVLFFGYTRFMSFTLYLSLNNGENIVFV